MKLKIVPVRQIHKRKVKVWIDATLDTAQAYELRTVSKSRFMRRVSSLSEAKRLVALHAPPKRPVDRDSMIGKRWNDVKDKL